MEDGISEEDGKNILREYYSMLYLDIHGDHLHQTMVMLVDQITNRLTLKRGNILNLGSAGQTLEKELLDSLIQSNLTRLLFGCTYVTVDYAPIMPEMLLMNEYWMWSYRLQTLSRIHQPKHTMMDGSNLAFKDNEFEIVVSNLALDIMPRQSILETYRVLNSGGYLICNFHTADLYKLLSKANPAKDQLLINSILYLKSTQKIFKNKYQINKTLKSAGFKNIEIRLYVVGPNKSANRFRWWNVVAQK